MKNIRIFYLKNFHFSVVKLSMYWNRHVFVMVYEKMAWFGIADLHAGWLGRDGVFPRHRMIDPYQSILRKGQFPNLVGGIGVFCRPEIAKIVPIAYPRWPPRQSSCKIILNFS